MIRPDFLNTSCGEWHRYQTHGVSHVYIIFDTAIATVPTEQWNKDFQKYLRACESPRLSVQIAAKS